MTFHEVIGRALEVRRLYERYEQERYGRSWTDEEITLGFLGDMGDLAKLVLAKNGVRAIPDAQEKLAHELADCLWSVIVLADLHGIDLEEAFQRTMREIEEHINSSSES